MLITAMAVMCLSLFGCRTRTEIRANVGDIITFGAYEQDNDTSNGKEDIEWIVLEKEDDRILVISRYALDIQKYNTSRTGVTWETCSLRKWLNETFLNDAFSKRERAMIPSVSVSADMNPYSSISPGNSTTDQVFLLSSTEADKYFSTDSRCLCQGPADCLAKGNYKTDNDNVHWWLRPPGTHYFAAAAVTHHPSILYGYISYSGADVDRPIAVRPALWINLGS